MHEVLFRAAGNPDSARQDTPLKAQGNDRLQLEHPRARKEKYQSASSCETPFRAT